MKNYQIVAFINQEGKILYYTYRHIQGTPLITERQRKRLDEIVDGMNEALKYDGNTI